MEQLIPSFTRVQLGQDQPSELIARFPQLESAVLSGDMTMSPSDLLLLLDRPSPASIASSLAQLRSSSTPDKAALLHRAVHTPTALSSGEIDLLRRRFWPSHEYDGCQAAWAGALAKLESDTSEQHMVSTVERLRKVREKLAGDEEKAFEAAQQEWVRRLMSGTTSMPKACWGYAIYYDPDAGADDEDFQVRVSASLQWARDVSAVAKNAQGNWTLHRMGWPTGATGEHKRGLFERLRRDFETVRDALPEGILKNVFLVVDRDSVHSVLNGPEGGNVCDDMWVWAVDPEYRDDTQEGQDTAQEQEAAAYPGYVRVRLQQLVNNFYVARRPDEDNNTVPLETLWACAQKSYQRAFVSVREEDFQKWVPNRDVGSCLRQ
ncbi:hypothetical protein ColTof4_12222 [Colletotrichum tofieldiae]|uniref:Uncharacterized protein n=1 Tax=Colletotrichum tofieldiae TaxID=708197 RepID=A0A166Y939_9PEZI|nr:hypothetical protein CT0861_03088 [Colletotrichum tofieldiae]GKT58292.1 hypothetical protein ColTof3_05631 [Colletotrichum tofieldiae]GKT79799.1 hypothetical protein ColTof4_12222 [Colletotrichum tofieldiae]